MIDRNSELRDLPPFQELNVAVPPATGTEDDEDDRDDERADENEAPVRETNENMEAPEEFAVDDEDAGVGEGEAADVDET